MPQLRPLFIFSLPRSGSTLLQRMLGAHSQVATASEPWLLLPLLYSLRTDGVYTKYNHGEAVRAIVDLCAQLPDGRATYLAEIRRFAMRVYSELAGPDARYFLDKSPRYHLVADDILGAFPEAKCVFLWRHPLAVAASTLDTWLQGRWQVYYHKIDLFEGLERLVDAYRHHAERVACVRYEDLVTAPERTLRSLLDHLELGWEPATVADQSSVELQGRLGDQTGRTAYSDVSVA
ncbi:MAG: sulfotransferase family protein, partial [Egibacteraceae bacterium]